MAIQRKAVSDVSRASVLCYFADRLILLRLGHQSEIFDCLLHRDATRAVSYCGKLGMPLLRLMDGAN